MRIRVFVGMRLLCRGGLVNSLVGSSLPIDPFAVVAALMVPSKSVDEKVSEGTSDKKIAGRPRKPFPDHVLSELITVCWNDDTFILMFADHGGHIQRR